MIDATESKAPKYFLPFLGPLYDGLAEYAYPLLRVTLGLFFIPHGWVKIFGGAYQGTAFFMAMTLGGHTKDQAGEFAGSWIPWAYYIGLLELVGGVLLVIGLLTRVVAAQYLVFMIVAWFGVHSGAWFWTNRGAEMPVLLGLLAIVVLIRGGGALSIDKALGREF